MKHRNCLYWLILAFSIVSIAIIFCAATITIRAHSDQMVRETQVQMERFQEKQETFAEQPQEKLAVIAKSESPVLLSHTAPDTYEEETLTEETEQDDNGGLECEFKEDVELLACVIYQEAGGDACCDLCRKRVADVVLNRVKDPRFKGTTIEEILTDGDPAPQWGLYSVTGVVWPDKAFQPSEAHAVERARETALTVLEGDHSDLSEDYIWCAEFPQGSNVIECCGIYFGA